MSVELDSEIELVEAPYYDAGKSGFHGDNLKAELGRMKDDIQAGRIKKGDIICVESHSRLGRLKPPKAIMQYLGFLRGGIRLDINGKLRSWRSINGDEGWQTLTDDLSDIFVAHKESLTKAKYARDTNALKRSKLRDGIKQGVMRDGAAGWFVGARCPAWLKPLSEANQDGYLYAVVDQVAKVVRLIFDLRESGLGCYRIAQRLIELGDEYEPFRNSHIKDPEKKFTKGWSQSMVARVLRNEAVIGRYQPMVMKDVLDDNDEPIRQIAVPEGPPRDDYYPPIITLNQWRRVRTLIERADRSGGANHGRTGKHFANIVKGLSTCPYCDGPVNLWKSTPKGGKARQELKCESARRKMIFPQGHRLAGQRCPNRRGFPYHVFEAALFSLFRPNMLPVLAEMIPQRQTDELLARRLVDCETKIAEYEQEIRRLVRLAAKAEDEMADAYDAEARTVQRELKRLRTENDRLQQQATSHTARYEEQIASILAKLTDASAPNALYETRARLNQLLGRHISVRLGEDRVMRININAHSGLAPVIALISLNGLEAIDVIDRDGSVLTRYEAGVLALLEPVNACRDEAGGHELDPCSISAPVSGLARYGAC